MSDKMKNVYSENVGWFCYEGSLALHDNYDESKHGYVVSDFDIECDNGAVNINTIALLESASVAIDEKDKAISELGKLGYELATILESAGNYCGANDIREYLDNLLAKHKQPKGENDE